MKIPLVVLVILALGILSGIEWSAHARQPATRATPAAQKSANDGLAHWKVRRFSEAVRCFQYAEDNGYNADWMRIVRAHSEFRLGHIALAAGEWAKAESLYAQGLARGKGLDNPVFKALPPWLEVARQRKKLGTFTPGRIHRVLAVFVEHSDFRVSNPQPKHVTSQLTDEHIQHALIGLGATRAFWEAATQGKIGIEFQTLRWRGPITKVRDNYRNTAYPHKRWNMHYETLIQALGPILTSRVDQFDTLYVVWSAGEQNVADASRVSIPLPDSGGYASRGAVQICGERLLEAPGALTVHEFFHIYEKLVGIELVHGFDPSNRLWFPEWKGNDEADYYLWQMSVYPKRRPYSR